LILVAALLPVVSAAPSDLQYELAGEDLYQIESAATVSRVSYTGTETLTVTPDDGGVRFEARARYVRDAADGKYNGGARFVTELLADGSFENRIDDDPDFLTILNQPFAVRVDSSTLQDLRALRGAVPFSGGSPLGGATVLRGQLRLGTSGPIDGRPSVAVRFQADGPMSGAMPGYTDSSVSGTMRMDGTAFYALSDGMLLAFNVRLTIDARLRQKDSGVFIPMHITYRRSLRFTRALPETDQAKTPR
jgi:hypothetical protein